MVFRRFNEKLFWEEEKEKLKIDPIKEGCTEHPQVCVFIIFYDYQNNFIFSSFSSHHLKKKTATVYNFLELQLNIAQKYFVKKIFIIKYLPFLA